MLTLLAFFVAIVLLIAVHEYGHYRMARACGVKVLRFSIGFGKALCRWQSKDQETEFVLSWLPMGGYVKMLNEREAPVSPELRYRAFNTQPLLSRVAIVAAGPLANLGLAVLFYTCVNWMGLELPAPILSRPQADTLASQAGVVGGERVLRAIIFGKAPIEIKSFDDVRWALTEGSLAGEDIELILTTAQGNERTASIKLSTLSRTEPDEQSFVKIGIVAPFSRPVIGNTLPDSAAQRAGLLSGDEVLSVDGQRVVDGAQLREWIRHPNTGEASAPKKWLVVREGKKIELTVAPIAVNEGEQVIGRIGAYVGSPPELVVVRFGILDGVFQAMEKTWHVSKLTIKMMGRMLIGQASIKNISGPLTIAEYAGKSASLGLTQYLIFLALISVSLGVLNLLPLPILDGGHLMYYLWEGVTGKSVSEAWLDRLQRGGIAILMVMMSVAVFNDLFRLLTS